MTLKNYFENGKSFFLRRQWAADLRATGRGRRLGYSSLRMLTLAAYEFVRNKCSLRAAWLTLIFIFSLAPALALGFAVAKGFGAQSHVQHIIYQTVGAEDAEGAPIPEADNIKAIIKPMLDYVDQLKVGALGLVGFVIVLYTAYQVLSSIELTLNDIWGIRQRRPVIRRLVDYLAVLFVFPLMMILTTLVVTALRSAPVISELHAVMPAGLTGLIGACVALTSAFFGFWFLYYFFPNTRVPVASSLAGAVVAAISWSLLQYVFVRLQVGVAKYNAIYGAFAAVPIFLLWLQSAWMVVLFGAEVAYAHARMTDYAYGGLGFAPSPAYREKVALSVMALSARQFSGELPPLSVREFSHEAAAPAHVVEEVIECLVRTSLLTEDACSRAHYVPAVPLQHLTVGRILRAVHTNGDEPDHAMKALNRLGVQHVLQARDKALETFQNAPILELARKSPTSQPSTSPASACTRE